MRRGLCVVLLSLVAAAPASARTDAARDTAFVWPADGTITSPFGLDGSRWHPGIDIGSLRSLTVRAASRGLVTQVGYVPGYEGYGNIVVLTLGSGFTTIYAHLEQTLVRPGARVQPGERVGIAGCTGWCTGTHLHFEVRHRGRPIDPLSLMFR